MIEDKVRPLGAGLSYYSIKRQILNQPAKYQLEGWARGLAGRQAGGVQTQEQF